MLLFGNFTYLEETLMIVASRAGFLSHILSSDKLLQTTLFFYYLTTIRIVLKISFTI